MKKSLSRKAASDHNRKPSTLYPTGSGGGTSLPGEVEFIDLFCGVGGFRVAVQGAAKSAGLKAVCRFSSDIDPACQDAYEANFGERPHGDIKQFTQERGLFGEAEVPDHDLLLAGFPCQPFSICGDMRGFEDTRGTLFFDIAMILKRKQPRAFVLENVKLLKGHDQGRTLRRILETLHGLGYVTTHAVLNALEFGLPQKRERIFIVGSLDQGLRDFDWGRLRRSPMKPLSKILEDDVPESYWASAHIRKKRAKTKLSVEGRTIWHENKSGHISALPYSCALRAGASYNYLLVDGVRRLTPREMFRLQGFPDTHKIIGNYSQARKQAGNSLPVPMAAAVVGELLRVVDLARSGLFVRDRGAVRVAIGE